MKYLLPPMIPNSKLARVRPTGKRGLMQASMQDLTSLEDPNTPTTIEVGARFRTTFYRCWRIVGVEAHEVVAVSEKSGQIMMLSPEAAARTFTEEKRIRPK